MPAWKASALALLFPMSAMGAESAWVGMGFGQGRNLSGYPDATAARHGQGFTLEFGASFRSSWGAGIEGGLYRLRSRAFPCSQAEYGCDEDGGRDDEINHLLFFWEYRPANKGWSLRLGTGRIDYCLGSPVYDENHDDVPDDF